MRPLIAGDWKMHGTSPQLIEIELRNGGVVIPVNAYESSRRRKSEVRSLGGKSERHGFQCAYPSRARRDPLGRIFRGGLGVGSRKPRGRMLCGSRAGVSARSLARRSPWS
jgi:hypothetical protein